MGGGGAYAILGFLGFVQSPSVVCLNVIPKRNAIIDPPESKQLASNEPHKPRGSGMLAQIEAMDSRPAKEEPEHIRCAFVCLSFFY